MTRIVWAWILVGWAIGVAAALGLAALFDFGESLSGIDGMAFGCGGIWFGGLYGIRRAYRS